MATPPGVNYAGTGGQNVDVVVAAFDNGSGVPQIVSVAHPMPVTVGGSSGGLSDTILTDDSLTQFLARDTGTAITYVTLAGAPYTPTTNVRAVTVAGGATSALQTTGNTSLATIAAGVKLQDGLGNVINSLFNATGDQELLTATGATNFTVSTNNSTVVQLAASATFTGVIESAFNAPAVSVLLACDQPGILTFNQYITTGAGTICNSVSYVTPATSGGNCFTQSWVVNGNDVNFTFQNTGGSTTTTLNLNVAYGNILPATSLLNLPVALREINGKVFNLGNQTPSNSISIVENYAITQTVVPVTASNVQLIAANSNRKYLAWMVVGTADVTVTAGTSAAVFGAGLIYQSSGTNKQGGSEEFPHGTPTNAFQCIAATTGSSVVVWEGQ